MDNQNVNINSEVMETVIGSKTKFKGTVSTDKPVKIEGDFEGIIESTSTVEITETGYFEGKCTCSQMNLAGEMLGEVACAELLTLALTGKFKGDAVTANIDIHPGSDFDGTLKIRKD